MHYTFSGNNAYLYLFVILFVECTVFEYLKSIQPGRQVWRLNDITELTSLNQPGTIKKKNTLDGFWIIELCVTTALGNKVIAAGR